MCVRAQHRPDPHPSVSARLCERQRWAQRPCAQQVRPEHHEPPQLDAHSGSTSSRPCYRGGRSPTDRVPVNDLGRHKVVGGTVERLEDPGPYGVSHGVYPRRGREEVGWTREQVDIGTGGRVDGWTGRRVDTWTGGYVDG